MSSLNTSPTFSATADAVTACFARHGVKLTMGGEPSYVPLDPSGPEWSITALGPTKIRYSYALAGDLLKETLPGALAILSPGKAYPGETNPRWAIHLLSNRDGSALVPSLGTPPSPKPSRAPLTGLRHKLLGELRILGKWLRVRDTSRPEAEIWVLPLDHDGAKWVTANWPLPDGPELTLINAEGPAGLRLPLGALPPDTLKRALVFEAKDDGLHIFLPPLLQKPFLELIELLAGAFPISANGVHFFEGYIPGDEDERWSKLSLTPDPGVLEINLPPCESAARYAWWLERLEACGVGAGLRSFKQPSPDEILGTGGGNHLLFGGPSLNENAFFTHPRWVTSILRYWQHHPSLSYLFTGSYVGASSQAPRPDESARELYDLEMAYQFLEGLEPGGDYRSLISETLRHLHIDRAGNTHRSEISFDKFWNAGWDGGCRGLIEFRAIESLPHAIWMSAVALLWSALAAFLLEKEFTAPLVEHGQKLHDHYFLPTPLWLDLQKVLHDLSGAGFALDEDIFHAIWEYRFPKMLDFTDASGSLTVRKALESWPLLCETPLEGGSTSRFVDTSIERLEFLAEPGFTAAYRVFIQGRELKLGKFPGSLVGAGLRYRRSALYPSLHPGITPHMPLFVTLLRRKDRQVSTYRLDADRRRFEPAEGHSVTLSRRPCQKLRRELLTCDLRLP